MEYPQSPPPDAESLLNEGIVAVNAGHMYYEKCIVDDKHNGPVFIKAHNEALFTNPQAALHTLEHLQHEGAVYASLRSTPFQALPDRVHFDELAHVLYLSAQQEKDGWYWHIPDEPLLKERYVYDVLTAFQELESLSATVLPQNGRVASLDKMYQDGWQTLRHPNVAQLALEQLDRFSVDFYPHVALGADYVRSLLNGNTEYIEEYLQPYLLKPRTAVGHFDARQSNIAWHPDRGASIVDWSWASPAVPGCDRTMFVVDLFKSGYLDDAASDNFDKDYALLLIGYWTARSTLPTANKDETVRFHQLASAISAATLLEHTKV